MVIRACSLGLVLVAGLTLQGCSPLEGADPEVAREVRTGQADVRLVDEQDADLHLFISNQSFDDQEVRLTVEVDGVLVVDDDFHVEGQHNWIQFPLAMSPGEHEITAESDSGATLSETFRVPEGDRRWAVLDHWGEGATADLSWSFHRKPVAFA